MDYPGAEELVNSLQTLGATTHQAADDQDGCSPIFLLGTGWRTGSTLLQRILVTDPNVLIWGEPLGEVGLVSGIAEMLNRISGSPGLEKLFAGDNLTSNQMATSWIATLYPPPDDLRTALRSLLDRWLGDPARTRGFVRWGFKETRLGAAEAVFLHWLYPNSKFVILSRHPYDCYKSLADSGWHHVYYRRPDIRVDSAAGFARHWNRLALSWASLPSGFPCVRLKYENLISDKVDFRQLESWLGVKLAEDVALSAVVGRRAVRAHLSWYESFIIAREAAAGMRALGYSA
ncbi:MAG: sulfotransferase family protein [Terriglobales bacterium]